MSETKPLICWGASGHAKVLHEIVQRNGERLDAVFDRDADRMSPFVDVPIYHGEEGMANWMRAMSVEAFRFIAGIGINGRRKVVTEWLRSLGGEPVTLVHPAGHVASTAALAPGCQVLVHASVSVEAVLGEGCIINSNASVDHECELGDWVHVAPGATLCGCVCVGEGSFIGAGTTVIPRVRIGRNVTVGAGSVVIRDLPDDAVAYGVPARVQRFATA